MTEEETKQTAEEVQEESPKVEEATTEQTPKVEETAIETVEDNKESKEEKAKATDTKDETPRTEEKAKPQKDERSGIAHVYSTYNNSMVHITDMAGNTIARITGGLVTKQSRLKANPTTAMFVAKRAAERARDVGITSLYIRTRAKTGSTGSGPGSHAAVKQLGKEGFRILSVTDVTRLPRGGPKKKGGKRGRRV